MDDYVSMGDPANNSLDIGANGTLEAWVRFDQLPSGNLYTIASKDAGGGGTNKWIFGYGNSYSNVTNSTFLHINRAAGGSVFLTSNPWTPVIGRWYHLAVAKSGDNYSFYRDGVLEGTPTTTVQIPDVTAAFEVGRAEGAFHFRGSIDNLRLWNVAHAG